jgi:hypothetical protein
VVTAAIVLALQQGRQAEDAITLAVCLLVLITLKFVFTGDNDQ